MGLVFSELNENYTLKNVIDCKRYNITSCKDHDCKLTHKNFNYISSRMRHFLDYHKEFFQKADFIIVERQPPLGLIIIQELLLFAYPNITLISPRSMHAFFKIGHLDYENRKIQTEKIAEKRLMKFKSYQKEERKHDISDAYCMLKFWIGTAGNALNQKREVELWKLRNKTIIGNFEQFKYIEE